MTDLIFNQRYNVCPRYPTGTMWEVHMRSRYASCSWNMLTFADALKYLRGQYRKEVTATKALRNIGDEHREKEFGGYIDGPGGRLAWGTIEALVKRH
jgi:hypothetical protein